MRSALYALAIVVLVASAAGAVPANNQVPTRADVVAGVSAATFAWKSTAQGGSTQAADLTWFTTYVGNTGSCPNGGNATQYVAVWSDFLSCKSTASSAKSTSIAGSAVGSASCNTTCSGSGGSTQPASPLVVSVPVSIIGTSNPVIVTVGSLTGSGSPTCTSYSWSIKDNVSTQQGSGSGTLSANPAAVTITTGAVGTWKYTLNCTVPTPVTGVTSAQVTSSNGTVSSYF